MNERMSCLFKEWINEWLTDWMNEWMNEWMIDWLGEWIVIDLRYRTIGLQTDRQAEPVYTLHICTRYVLQSVGLSIYQLVKQTVDDQPCARGRCVLFLFINKNNSNAQKLRPDMTWHDMRPDMIWDETWRLVWWDSQSVWRGLEDLTWHDMTWHDMTWQDTWYLTSCLMRFSKCLANLTPSLTWAWRPSTPKLRMTNHNFNARNRLLNCNCQCM